MSPFPDYRPARHRYLIIYAVLDSMPGALPPKTGLLDTAERNHFVRQNARVDADHPRFDCFGYPEDPADVAGVEIGGKSEFGIVGDGDDFVSDLNRNRGATGPKVSSDAMRIRPVTSVNTVG